MANQNLNPLSRLLDIDFPDFKRANWNNSFDAILTNDVGFVKPVFVDRLMAGCRASLDFDTASFANATKSPLYGRYKVKYLAFWAPDRLYMADWLSGEKMEDDDYPYPRLRMGLSSAPTDFFNYDYNSNITLPRDRIVTGAGLPYVPPTSLIEFLGYWPSYTSIGTFGLLPYKNAFAFLAFWDAYRNFILNPQEDRFPVRTRGVVRPTVVVQTDGSTSEVQTLFENPLAPVDTMVSRDSVDLFFKEIKRNNQGIIINNTFRNYFGFEICPAKRILRTRIRRDATASVVPSDNPMDYLLLNDFHYGCPIAPYMADPFTSFVSNENVEIERQKSTVKATINGTTADFTMEQWYLASRMQSKVRRNIYKFQDFATWIDTNFGVKPPTTLTQPMFLGAFSSDVIFNDAISNTQGDSNVLGDNKSLGSRAGFGVGKNGDRSNFFDFTALEPGTVMILQWIVPEVHYFEGVNPMFDTLNFNEEYNPIFDALGFQDMHRATFNSNPALRYDPFGRKVLLTGESSVLDFSTYDVAVAQQPYAFEHMCRPNRLMGMMTMPNYYQSWSLARSFNYNRADPNFYNEDIGEFDTSRLESTYIVPEMYNNIFANEQDMDNFQFYLSFNYKKYQPLSKQFLSFT